MGMTYHLYSDAWAYTIIEISKNGKRFKAQRDKAVLSPDFKPNIIPGGFIGHTVNNHSQSYTYERDPNGEVITVTLRKNGKWTKSGEGMHANNIGLDYRSEFYDYNF